MCLSSAKASEKIYLDLDESKTDDLSLVRVRGSMMWSTDPKTAREFCIFSCSGFINNTSSAPQPSCATSFFTSCEVSCCDYIMLLA